MATRDPFVIRKYLGIQAAWFISAGLQMVMYPFLLKVVLDVPAGQIGFATFAMTFPMFLLMLPGGALADRIDGRHILSVTHGLAVIPPALLATAIVFDQLSYPVMLIYGVSIGIVGAFSQPARDSLLNRVVQTDGGRINLQRAVGLATLTMFVCQIIGMFIALTADNIGTEWVIICQGVVLFASLGLIRSLRLDAVEQRTDTWTLKAQLSEIGSGLKEAFGSPQIMPVVIVAFLIGMFYIGSFQVLMPVLVTETYGEESWRLGLGPMTFFSGTIVTSMLLIRRGGVERAGMALTLAVCTGTVVLFSLSVTVPYLVFLLFIFVWGLGAGVAITMSRTIVQELAPESHRGRLLSIFSMGFMGGAPLGALMIGPIIDATDPHIAALFPGTAMVICLTTLLLTTQLFRVRLTGHKASAIPSTAEEQSDKLSAEIAATPVTARMTEEPKS